jgi:hypothetical protein
VWRGVSEGNFGEYRLGNLLESIVDDRSTRSPAFYFPFSQPLVAVADSGFASDRHGAVTNAHGVFQCVHHVTFAALDESRRGSDPTTVQL